MTNHINALIAGMGNASYAVDVVNEAVADSGSETFKPSPPWYPAVPDYVEQAFRLADAARKASGVPNLLLFYNECVVRKTTADAQTGGRPPARGQARPRDACAAGTPTCRPRARRPPLISLLSPPVTPPPPPRVLSF